MPEVFNIIVISGTFADFERTSADVQNRLTTNNVSVNVRRCLMSENLAGVTSYNTDGIVIDSSAVLLDDYKRIFAIVKMIHANFGISVYTVEYKTGKHTTCVTFNDVFEGI